MPFTALGLDSHLTKAVREAGYTEPTPIQTRAIPTVLSGRDVIGIAQTGTGKTAAFVLPILQRLSAHKAGAAAPRRRMRALVIAPTRELVAQIEENARKYGRHLPLRTATIYGGVGEQPQIAALRSGVDLVIATPGRLIDLMQQGHVHFSDIEVVVLDEADRMLDMGFLPAIRQIVRASPRSVRRSSSPPPSPRRSRSSPPSSCAIRRPCRSAAAPTRPRPSSRPCTRCRRAARARSSSTSCATAPSTPCSSSPAPSTARTRSPASSPRPA